MLVKSIRMVQYRVIPFGYKQTQEDGIMTNSVVRVSNVEKVYGKKGENQYKALNNVSMEIDKGEFVGIMGPSGSGKTTLLNVISTLDGISNGKIQIDGTDITTMNQNQLADFRAQKLGFIFQDFNLLESMTVYENIALPLSLQNVSTKEISPKVHAVAKTLDIEPILQKYPAQLSGGKSNDQQRHVHLFTTLACCLGMNRRELLIQRMHRACLRP